MKTRTRIILWAGLLVYGLGLFSALTFYRLPADKILSRAIEEISGGKMHLSTGKMSSSLWKGHHLENLTWTIQLEDFVAVEPMAYLTLSTNFLRYFQGYVPLRLKGVLGRGAFDMSAGVSMFRGLDKAYAKIDAADILLGDLAALSRFAQRRIKGQVTGRAELSGSFHDLRKIIGQGTIVIEDGAMDMRAEVFGIKTLPFSKITIPFSLRNGAAEIKKGEIEGPLFGGDFEGQIGLHPDLQAGSLEVAATIRPGPSLQQGQVGNLPALKDRPILIQLQGTVAKPMISWTGAF